ncbi:hypothetical protein [Microcoleus sp. PH2017_25_DOB_D_A]|nr:hypothetical protein [Microcoleus sp. PH2017_25_DOB_D_A]
MLINRMPSAFDLASDFKNQSTAGILLVNQRRQIVGMTPNLVKIWHLPEVIVRSQSDELALEVVSNQFDNPHRFLSDMTEIYATLELDLHKIIQLRDCRKIERRSQPLWINRIYAGRMWAFQVTE